MTFEIPANFESNNLNPFLMDWGIQLPKQPTFVEKNENATPVITEDDYSDEEQNILKVLKREIREASAVNTIWSKRKKALEWCFVRGTHSKEGIDFRTGCIALGARPEVLQARLHLQLYLRCIPLKEPLHFMSDPIPEQYESEAILCAWEDGLKIVRKVWKHPGMPLIELMDACINPEFDAPVENFDAAIDKLIRNGLVSIRMGFVFLTWKSEKKLKSHSFSWGRSFL